MFYRLGVCSPYDDFFCWPANSGRTEAARIVAAQSANLVLIERSKRNGKEAPQQSKSFLHPSANMASLMA
jgi:hypothetical protein